jgi:hypothetical protein
MSVIRASSPLRYDDAAKCAPFATRCGVKATAHAQGRNNPPHGRAMPKRAELAVFEGFTLIPEVK